MLFDLLVFHVTAGGETSGSKGKSKAGGSKGTTTTTNTTTTTSTTSSESGIEHLPPNQPAGNEYKVPEYYQYNINSYADYMVDMSKQRLPRPQRPGRN